MVGAALLVTVVAESALLVGGDRFVGWTGLALVLVASAAWAALVTTERVDRRPRLVLAAISVVLLVAVAVPPLLSRDLWSYAMYGRTLAVHHVSPFVHPPSDFAHDAFLAHVATGWRTKPSVYGPLFTGVSALFMHAAGDSSLQARLAFQSLAAAGVLAALAIVWRETRSARALAFVGLNPAIVIAVVNGGHNDALVGLAVLAGAVLALRNRWSAAGFVLGIGLLVKASTGLGLIGIVAWSFHRDRRGAARLLAIAAATTIVGYLPAGVVAVRDATHAGHGNTRSSPWDPITTLTHIDLGIVLVLVVLLAGGAAYLRRDRPRPAAPALASAAAYLMAGAYVLPWYSVWALPLAALERRSRIAWLVAAQSVFLLAIYEFEPPAHPMLSGVFAGFRITAVQLGSWALLAAYVVIVLGNRRPITAGRRLRSRLPSLRPAE